MIMKPSWARYPPFSVGPQTSLNKTKLPEWEKDGKGNNLLGSIGRVYPQQNPPLKKQNISYAPYEPFTSLLTHHTLPNQQTATPQREGKAPNEIEVPNDGRVHVPMGSHPTSEAPRGRDDHLG